MPRESSRVDVELLARYSGAGPRYTSYPTVPEWSREFGAAQAREAFARAALSTKPLSIYVHLPFCAELCLYCGCTVQITRRADIVESYLDALDVEIARAADLLGARRDVAQMHWGGGTPTHLSPEQIERLHASLSRHFRFLPGAELSIEVHPHVTGTDHIDTLAGLGFKRVSMGVQDLDARVQEVVHRYQTTEETQALVEHCRKVGVTGINLDLMYGLPEQSEATFAATLDTVAALRPDRLAVYAYAHVPWLKPFQKALEQHDLPDAPRRAGLFALALERLAAEDYEVIGLDHFALRSDALYGALQNGSLHRNFMGYTTHPAEESLALGMSAISDLGGAYFQNESTTREYERRVTGGELAVQRGLRRSAEDDLRRAVIQDVMCAMVVDLDQLGARFGRTDLREHFAQEWKLLEPLAGEGFCELEPGRLRVLPRGRLFLRHLAMAFDAYVRRERPAAGPRFSQTL
jgi:oxygen-independent coproporphyrinogen III oxidase